ncbi:MAG: heparinase II/III family protein [Verrucomicrobiaceae bacterium]|nr:heparinase II/III family protein [Verrucomicrobiaceae bacterium]
MKWLKHSLFICLSGIAVLGQEVREWTDKTSGKKLSASMESADPAKRTVTLKAANGQTYVLQVDRLVDADLVYIREQLTKPAAAPTAAPAPGAPPAATPAPAAAAVPAGQPAPPPPALTITPAKKFKFPNGSQILGAVKRERPRVFLNAAGLAAVKAKAGSDAISQALAKNVEKTGDVWLSKYELQQKRGEGGRGGGVGAEGVHRFLSFGLMQAINGDPKWKARMPSELEALSKFTNWKPDEPPECAEFVLAVSLGYDWFRATLNEAQAKTIKTALIQLGMDALSAHLKEEPLPVTAKRPEPGQTAEAPKPVAKKKGPEEKRPVTSEEMVMASALLVAAIAIVDEESAVASPAANVAAKVLGEGLTQFAPEGIWSEGVSRGEDVLDALSFLSMTLRAATGSDFGLTLVEGLPQSAWARILLNGPGGIFNYCSFEGNGLNKPWINAWLTMNYGNLGLPAFKPGGPASDQSGGINQAGLLVLQNPYFAGVAVPPALDHLLPQAQVISMRTGWHDNKAMYVGLKGGDNALPGSQLDLGTFVLDAAGQRWGIELGTYQLQGRPLNLMDNNRFKQYRSNTLGQNVVRFGGAPDPDDKDDKKKPAPKGQPTVPQEPFNQINDGKATVVAFDSNPQRGAAILDLADAYSNRVKDYQRGVMLNRGATPYVVIQDELSIKNASDPEWVMHTKAEVTVNGKTATLKQGNTTLTATLLSPADASFATAAVPEPTNTQAEGSFKGVSTLSVPLKQVKGEHTFTIVFSQGDKAPEVAVVPLEKWIEKKR